jgi:hypothetical protein
VAVPLDRLSIYPEADPEGKNDSFGWLIRHMMKDERKKRRCWL